MNKKVITKIISIALMIILAMLVFAPHSQAKEANDLWQDGKDFINAGKNSTNAPVETKQIQEALMPIGRILVTIATIVLTVVTICMAIRYMMCDSAEGQAKLKTQLIGLVVSTIVIYGAQIIWALILNAMTEITG